MKRIDIWDYLHDGTITKIEGNLPDVVVTVDIAYLRNMFPYDGDSIILKIKGCSLAEYKLWDEDSNIVDISKIVSLEPEIVSVTEEENHLNITCVEGELFLNYNDIVFELDNGKPISITDIKNASFEYWDAWEKKHKK